MRWKDGRLRLRMAGFSVEDSTPRGTTILAVLLPQSAVP